MYLKLWYRDQIHQIILAKFWRWLKRDSEATKSLSMPLSILRVPYKNLLPALGWTPKIPMHVVSSLSWLLSPLEQAWQRKQSDCVFIKWAASRLAHQSLMQTMSLAHQQANIKLLFLAFITTLVWFHGHYLPLLTLNCLHYSPSQVEADASRWPQICLETSCMLRVVVAWACEVQPMRAWTGYWCPY